LAKWRKHVEDLLSFERKGSWMNTKQPHFGKLGLIERRMAWFKP